MRLENIEFKTMNGTTKTLQDYDQKVILIVNTASKCGYTPQFEGLENLYQKYKDEGLQIIGFPCNQFLFQDPGTNKEILEYCQLNYGVTFDMMAKIKVKGKTMHPLYKYLTNNSLENRGKKIKWNFEKFLISKDFTIVKRYDPGVKPQDLVEDIENELKKGA